ncbi:MAG: IS91 family transposase [Thermoanaerobaculia bacterium]|nr:IS91 family transposase [Thermoanaerobaculia bacterium]
MPRPPWEVADVIRLYGEDYRQDQGASVPTSHRRVLHALETCRTAVLGGHVDACDHCGARQISYNSCRNRHCPKCQSLAKASWLEDRLDELLPVEYFHVVFTLPHQLASLGLQNKRCFYNLLFKATAETLRTIAADPKHLGAQIGFLAVLHTWGQTLTFHPHLHCIVPGGGFDPAGERWIACRPGFFLPVRVLSRFFRRCFLEALEATYDKGGLELYGSLDELREPETFRRWLDPLRDSEWIVYAKPPFGGPEKVLDYLGRYTHRVAIANHRILDVGDGKVSFRWRDYRHDNRLETMTLSAEEFLRRFLLHVLPDGFVRIRHFGWLANRHRTENIERARRLIAQQPPEAATVGERDPEPRSEPFAATPRLCPHCQRGQLVRVEIVPPITATTQRPRGVDSS